MNNWIKIEDEIPEEGLEILVFIPKTSQMLVASRYVNTDEGSEDCWVVSYDDFPYWEINEVTHWRLLPEEPEV